MNKNRELMIYDDDELGGFTYLFYDSSGEHRFDSTHIFNRNTLRVWYTVERFWYVEDNSSKRVNEDKRDIYITVFNQDKEPCAKLNKKLIPDRRYLKIAFSD